MADQSGFATLGAALGGDSELSYQQGLALGANTQNALAQARERVEKNRAQMNLKDQLVAAGVPENVAAASAGAQASGGNLGDVIGLLGKQQEQGFRATAGAPGSTDTERQAALAGVASGPFKTYETVGPHSYQNILHPEEGIKSLGAEVGGGGDAAAIQTLRAFGLLDPNGQVIHGREADAVRLIKQTQKFIDAGGVTYGAEQNNPFAGGAPTPVGPAPAGPGQPVSAPLAGPTQPAAPTPIVPVGQTAANAAAIAGAKKGAEIQNEKLQALPSTLLKLDDFERNVDNLLAEPGFDTIYGHIAGTDTGQAITGLLDFSNDSANAQAALGQIDAQSFGISIQTMRGLGQLSNQEGLKVQKAFALATNPRLSPDRARAAYADMKVHLAELRRVAKIEAGQGGAPGGEPVTTFNTEAEAAAAGLAPGTRITIGGVPGTWQ